ncbi:MAG: tetratricopeptide repeat protein [Crocinitomicaceae bacterium]|nr:tetratricopeptide repeat protein [Crocinitomicaceae bacterium]
MKWLLTYGFLIVAVFGIAQQDKFQEGNKLYESGNYEQAIEKYSSIVSQGYHSAELYYNLGNAYYRNGELGKSIWAFESALKIEPDHEDALFNLNFANAQTVDQIDTQRHGFEHWLQGLVFSSNINFWVWLSLICSVLLSFFASVFIINKNRKTRNFSLISGGLLAFGLIISILTGYLHKDYVTKRSKAVVITEQVNVMTSPTSDANISYKLSEGVKVRLISDDKDWVEIDLNGNKGWLQKTDVWAI